MAKAEQLLLCLASKSKRGLGTDCVFDTAKDYPLCTATDKGEAQYLLEYLKDRGLIKPRGADVQLTMDGWERARELMEAGPQSKRAFIAMWGDPDMEVICKDAFEPALRDTGWEPVCVNWKDESDKIDDTIFAEIRRCGLFVGDATGFRPSVFLEIGMALGLNRKWIFTCRDDWFDEKKTDAGGNPIKRPFDTHAFRHIVWTDIKDLKKKLVRRICSMGWQHTDPPPGYLLDDGEAS